MEVARVEPGEGDRREEQQDGQLDQHHHGVDRRGFGGALDQQQHAQHHENNRRQVELSRVPFRPVGARHEHRRVERGGHLPPRGVDEEVVEVVGPADRGRTGRQAVFQQQAGGHREGRDLAQRGVGERVRRPRGRNAERQFGVAQRRESGGDGGDEERQDDGGTGLGHGLGHGEEDARADRGAHADHRQREDAQRTFQGLAVGPPRMRGRFFRGLDANQFLDQRLRHAAPSSRSLVAATLTAGVGNGVGVIDGVSVDAGSS